MVFNMYSQPFAGLVLEELDNGGAVTGTTYRLYAQMNEGLVYSMWANEEYSHLIETTTTFYQDAFGADLQSGISTAFFALAPTLEWDSWVTLGDTYTDAPSTVGDLNFSSFSSSGSRKISSKAFISTLLVSMRHFCMLLCEPCLRITWYKSKPRVSQTQHL